MNWGKYKLIMIEQFFQFKNLYSVFCSSNSGRFVMIIQMRSFGYNIRIDITFLFSLIVLFGIADLLCRQIVVPGNDFVDDVVSCNKHT